MYLSIQKFGFFGSDHNRNKNAKSFLSFFYKPNLFKNLLCLKFKNSRLGRI